MFLPFCFYVGFVLGNFPCFVFVLFLSCVLFCFQSMTNTFSPEILVFFELCWLKGSLFLCFMSLFLFVLFLVLFGSSLNNEVALFCVCVVCFLFGEQD